MKKKVSNNMYKKIKKSLIGFLPPRPVEGALAFAPMFEGRRPAPTAHAGADPQIPPTSFSSQTPASLYLFLDPCFLFDRSSSSP